MKLKRKILSLCLALCLVILLVPAFAQQAQALDVGDLDFRNSGDQGDLTADSYHWDSSNQILQLSNAQVGTIYFPNGANATIESTGACEIDRIMEMDAAMNKAPSLTFSGAGSLTLEYLNLPICDTVTVAEGANVYIQGTGAEYEGYLSLGDGAHSGKLVVNGTLSFNQGRDSTSSILCGTLSIGPSGFLDLRANGEGRGIKLTAPGSGALTLADGSRVDASGCNGYAILFDMGYRDAAALLPTLVKAPQRYFPKDGNFYFGILTGDDTSKAVTLIEDGTESKLVYESGDVTGHVYSSLILPPPKPVAPNRDMTAHVELPESIPYTGKDQSLSELQGFSLTLTDNITGKPVTGATVKYGTAAGSCTQEKAPAFKELGTHTLFFTATASGYNDVSGQIDMVITKIPLSVTAKDQTLQSDCTILVAPDQITYEQALLAEGHTVTSVALTMDTANSIIVPSALKIEDSAHQDVTATYYDITYAEGKLTKLPSTYTQEPAAQSLTYNTQAQNLVSAGITDCGTILYSTAKDGPFAAAIPQGTNAGDYTVYYQIQGNQFHDDSPVSGPIAVTILPKVPDPLQGSLDQDVFLYDGTAKEPVLTLKDDDMTTVIPASEYTVSYTDNIRGDGNPRVIVVDKDGGNYDVGILEIGFTILQYELNGAQLDKDAVTYGEAFTLAFTPQLMKQSGNLLTSLMTLGQDNNTAVISCDGTRVQVLTDVTEGNPVLCTFKTAEKKIPARYFDGKPHDLKILWRGDNSDKFAEATLSLTLHPKALTPSLPNGMVGTYLGSTEVGSIPAQLEGLIPGDQVTAAGSGSLDQKDVGTRNLTVSKIKLSGDHADYYCLSQSSATTQVTVNPRVAELQWESLSQPYTGKAQAPTAKVANAAGKDIVTVTVSGAGTDAGTYTAKATGLSDPNYALPAEAECSYEITKVPAVITQAPKGLPCTFDKQPHGLVSPGTANGGEVRYSLQEDGPFEAQIPTGQAVGDYLVYYKAVGDKNHLDSEVESLKVRISGPNESPRTSDNFHSVLWITLLGVSAAAVTAGTLAVKKKRR